MRHLSFHEPIIRRGAPLPLVLQLVGSGGPLVASKMHIHSKCIAEMGLGTRNDAGTTETAIVGIVRNPLSSLQTACYCTIQHHQQHHHHPHRQPPPTTTQTTTTTALTIHCTLDEEDPLLQFTLFVYSLSRTSGCVTLQQCRQPSSSGVISIKRQ